MAMLKQCDIVKEVTHCAEPRERNTENSEFQFIVQLSAMHPDCFGSLLSQWCFWPVQATVFKET